MREALNTLTGEIVDIVYKVHSPVVAISSKAPNSKMILLHKQLFHLQFKFLGETK